MREDERNREKILSQSEIEHYKKIYKKYVDVTTEHRFISVINNENKKRMKLSKILGLKEKRNTIFKKSEGVMESEEKIKGKPINSITKH